MPNEDAYYASLEDAYYQRQDSDEVAEDAAYQEYEEQQFEQEDDR